MSLNTQKDDAHDRSMDILMKNAFSAKGLQPFASYSKTDKGLKGVQRDKYENQTHT